MDYKLYIELFNDILITHISMVFLEEQFSTYFPFHLISHKSNFFKYFLTHAKQLTTYRTIPSFMCQFLSVDFYVSSFMYEVLCIQWVKC